MKLVDEAIKHYGDTHQKVVAMEEMSELIKEISKDIRGQGNIDHITEEVADVYIMLMQLEKMYGITLSALHAKINKKLERLKERITNEQEHRKIEHIPD